jgi:hypothetical protein
MESESASSSISWTSVEVPTMATSSAKSKELIDVRSGPTLGVVICAALRRTSGKRIYIDRVQLWAQH